jgi:lysophospholipid acyltransferase
MELINETMFQHAHVKATLKAGRRLPPGRKRAAYTKMVMGLIYLGAFVVLGGKYNYSVSLTDEFARMPLLKRYVECWVFDTVLMRYQHRSLPAGWSD